MYLFIHFFAYFVYVFLVSPVKPNIQLHSTVYTVYLIQYITIVGKVKIFLIFQFIIISSGGQTTGQPILLRPPPAMAMMTPHNQDSARTTGVLWTPAAVHTLWLDTICRTSSYISKS